MHDFPMPVYSANAVKEWEKRWFGLGNSSFGLMQQAALAMANTLKAHLKPDDSVCIWCGAGNNGGDGYLLGVYLSEHYQVSIYPALPAVSADAVRAYDCAQAAGVPLQSPNEADVHIDALFGNGLTRPLDADWCAVIERFNTMKGVKIAIDIPSGLHPDTGMPLPSAVVADMTLCLMGYKAGLFMGHAKSHVGHLINHPLIPKDEHLIPIAMTDDRLPRLPDRSQRSSHLHKGSFGSVMVIGSSALMGGAALMSAEAAIRVGAGRVTVMTHPNHHSAIISRSPNLMLGRIDQIDQAWLSGMNAVCFGMGLGRDEWAQNIFKEWLAALMAHHIPTVLDADALWHLADQPRRLPDHCIGTPHHAEAGRLLGISAAQVEADRMDAICCLQLRYGGQWVLKGANSLSIDAAGNVSICTLGSAAMATAGMGDVLSGMMAGLLAQDAALPCAQIVALHAKSGDVLSQESICADVNNMGNIAAKLLKTSAISSND
ncbi:bifunctional ADP-dependent NAD(P)H-hydrate dehydratase/NAD(P)H-hydrate epimerase [Moraxella catarrhalis]|uniref:ADP-dependent (S)-NAD(P)H-hydrate dehydratase n=1 Tax=Moraxella catarrhalis TaxID=480 RepID=A0A198UGC5_MORCA|nr:bifunctional ADP-dependent NAD(P)H-hydrate dehydratase/NAD(P)H-hydrate epimerase [Moraxella catarrhalis]OAU95025.1 NADPHX epimerase [Moraxella catarrhalis]OAU95369.1 NADPHX epimerase [Moraxella catarrhalis]OAU98249.1 NADPHX epimerase [Moraxella catarrhalis]